MAVLALDIATTTGWAVALSGGSIQSGRLRLNKGIRQGERLHQFRKFLTELKVRLECRGDPLTAITYEHAFRQQGHANELFHNMTGVLMQWCEHHGIEYDKINVSSIKRHATGSGKASKEDMKKAANDLGFTVIDDNEADAIHLLRLKISEQRK